MQQTTYGVIPKKKKVFNRKEVDNFLDESNIMFDDLRNSQQCLYSDMNLVSDQALNYLNTFSGNECKEQLKLLLKKEFIECEKIYPYLGDFFIKKYFSKENKEIYDKHLFCKDSSKYFIDSFKFKELKSIFKWIIENASREYTVSIHSSKLTDIYVEKKNVLNFDLDYDTSFLGGKDFHTMSDYKFIIIDGYVESIGEIHHLLDQANKTKVPHVIFCFGMSDEVSHVIKHNNSHSKFEVMPIIITFDENTINVLNDIAVLHKDNIVSSRTGETISQAVRSNLSVGREITFHKKGFKIKPVASEADLVIHRSFLSNKLNKITVHEESKKLLSKRIKRFTNKSIKLFIPEILYSNNDFIREVDYMMRLTGHSNKVFCVVSLNSSAYYLPKNLINFVNKKVNSIKNIYSQIDRLVIHAGN